MEKIISSLKCVNCKQVLSTPVVLPCSHLICKSHTETTDQLITCLECGATHTTKEYMHVKAVEDMINAQLASFDFGQNHSAALKSLKKLTKMLEKNESISRDFQSFLVETIAELKNKVYVEREEIKLLVDQRTDEIITSIEEFQRRCLTNLNSMSLVLKLGEFEKESGTAKVKCHEWSNELNQLRIDEEKWKKIHQECEMSAKNLREKLDEIVNDAFLGELDSHRKTCEFFNHINIFNTLKLNLRIFLIFFGFVFSCFEKFLHFLAT